MSWAPARESPTASYAPMSQAAPWGRLIARWSVAGQSKELAASIAGLAGGSAWVNVGPPLLRNGSSSRSALSRASAPRPQDASLLRLLPPEITPTQLPPDRLPAMIEFLIVTEVFRPHLLIAPPEPAALPENVLLLIVTAAELPQPVTSAPPKCAPPPIRAS